MAAVRAVRRYRRRLQLPVRPLPTAPAPIPIAAKNVLFVGDGANNVLAAFDILAPEKPKR